MNVEFSHREIRLSVSPDRRGERMWTIYPEPNVIITGTVERQGLKDTLRAAIIAAQGAIDEWAGLPA